MKTSTSIRSPLSPTRWPSSAFVWWRSLLFAVGLVGAVLVASVAFGVVAIALYGADAIKHPSPGLTLLAQLIGVYAPVVLLLTMVLPRIAQRSLAELGLRPPTASDVGWGLVGAIAMLIVIETLGAIEQNIFHLKISETAVDLLKSTHGPLTVAFAVFACVAAPFVEEFVFRGFLYNAFRRYLPAAWAALSSALCFGLAHGDPHSLGAVLPLAGGGIVLAAIYERTGSLSATMIAHGTFNFVSILGLLVFHVG